MLVQTKGRFFGLPFDLLEWQKDRFIGPLYGWKRPCGKLRRFESADVFVAKKQGKTATAAGLICATMAKSGFRSEIYGVAHTKGQATTVFDHAAAFARHSPVLAAEFTIQDSVNNKNIQFPAKETKYSLMAGERGHKQAEGKEPTFIVVDEIHVMTNRKLWDALAYASNSVPNSLTLSISTVGEEDPTAIWWEQYEYCQQLLRGDITDHHKFAFIAQASEKVKTKREARWDRNEWRAAMPSLGHTVPEYKIEQALQAAENSPAKMASVIRYIFNQPTGAAARIIDTDKWRECVSDDLPKPGRDVYVGLDMASSEDLTALVLYFPPADDLPAFVRSYFFCPERKVALREKAGKVHYRGWVDSGWLIETPGARVDHDTILATFYEVTAEYNIQEIPFDKWGADPIVNPLQLNGYPVVSIAQTFEGLAAGCKEVVDRIAEGEIRHDGNQCMTWCLGNTAAVVKEEDVMRFSKDRSPDKIDGAVALAMAMGRALQYEPVSGSLFLT